MGLHWKSRKIRGLTIINNREVWIKMGEMASIREFVFGIKMQNLRFGGKESSREGLG
jgi:hypothetical protein